MSKNEYQSWKKGKNQRILNKSAPLTDLIICSWLCCGLLSISTFYGHGEQPFCPNRDLFFWSGCRTGVKNGRTSNRLYSRNIQIHYSNKYNLKNNTSLYISSCLKVEVMLFLRNWKHKNVPALHMYILLSTMIIISHLAYLHNKHSS